MLLNKSMFACLQVLDKKQIIVESAIQQCKDEAAIQVCTHLASTLSQLIDPWTWQLILIWIDVTTNIVMYSIISNFIVVKFLF